MDKYNILKEKIKLAVDLDNLLLALGFSVFKNTSKELRCPCIIHGGDNPTSFCLKKESGRFYCFSHSCEKNDSGSIDNDIFSLVQKVKHCDFLEALSFVGSLCGIDVDDEFAVTEKELENLFLLKDKNFFINIQKHMEQPKNSVNEDLVARAISKGSSYFENQGFSADVITQFNLGTYVDRHGHERALVPLYDGESKLVGYSGRITHEKYKDLKIPKYDISWNSQKSALLYNLDRAKLFLRDYCFIIIVEGFKAVWYLDSIGYPNTVAIMGSSITEGQIKQLIKYGISDVVLFLDWDKAGRSGQKESSKLLKKYYINYQQINFDQDLFDQNKKQPDCFSSAEIDQFLEQARKGKKHGR